MISRRVIIPILLITATHLAGCNDSAYSKPPNVAVSGIVERIEKTTRSSMGSRWATYEIKLSNANPSDLHYVTVSGRTITDSDLAPSVGQQVAIKCCREDLQSPCYASRYAYGGGTLIFRRNDQRTSLLSSSTTGGARL